MIGRREVIAELLETVVGSKGVAAVCVEEEGRGEKVVLVWRPSDLQNEPRFLVYSITKTFIGVLLLQLQEEGRLALDDCLARWFPNIQNAEEITLRQMLRHTAGIPDYGSLHSYHQDLRNNPEKAWTFERFVAETAKQGSLFSPATNWAYSNPGFMLLKQIAEVTGGSSLKNIVNQQITTPLGLADTSVVESIPDLVTLAPAPSRYLSSKNECCDTREHYHPGWVSHGVVASTPSNIVRFYSGLFAGDLISPTSLTEMTTPVPVPNAPPRWTNPCYGLGLMIDDQTPWGRVWGHGGSGPGYTSFALHAPDFPTGSRTICALCGIEEGNVAEDLVFHLLELE